jgi:hypothetical protein
MFVYAAHEYDTKPGEALQLGAHVTFYDMTITMIVGNTGRIKEQGSKSASNLGTDLKETRGMKKTPVTMAVTIGRLQHQ